jgi:hypothetical protein
METTTAGEVYPPEGTFVMVRATGAGVHFGTLAAVSPTAVRLTGARRVWSWTSDDQYTLSELAVSGAVTLCKLGQPVDVTVGGWCELIVMSADAADRMIAANSWA